MKPKATEAAPGPPVKEIQVMLDRPRTMRLDVNAMEVLEDITGKNMMNGEFRGDSVRDVRAFFFACLVWEDPELTIEKVGEFLYVDQFAEAISIMLRLMTNTEEDPVALAPFVPTIQEVILEALEAADLKPTDELWDLGCGDGRVLALAGRKCRKVVGIERDKRRAAVARALIRQMNVNGVVLEQTIQETDVTGADVVFVYLLTSSNVKISGALEAQLKPGARVVSHDFAFPSWRPYAERHIEVKDGRRHTVYAYRIGEHRIDGAPEPVAPSMPMEVEAAPDAEYTDEEVQAAIRNTFADIPELERLYDETFIPSRELPNEAGLLPLLGPGTSGEQAPDLEDA